MKTKHKIGPILYIHGFNSGPGDKSNLLLKEFIGEVILCPQLIDGNLIKSLEILEEVIKKQKPKHIIGTSLGAFYAMLLSITDTERYYYIINPSFNPQESLNTYLNKKKVNYKTGNKYLITSEFIDQLKLAKELITSSYLEKQINSSNYYIGREDTLLDYTEFTDFLYNFKCPIRLRVTNNDHRYSDLTEVIYDIKENSII